MNSNQHESVVSKMCEMFEVVPTKCVPQLVQELLHLCKDDHIVIVFLKLQKYFFKRLHSLENVKMEEIRKHYS